MRKYFITGLVILLPLAVTIAVIAFIVNFITGPFYAFVSTIMDRVPIPDNGLLFLSHDQLLRYFSKLAILVAIFFFTMFLGMITRWLFIKSVINIGDQILHRIPIINTVYKTTQDIIKTLFVSNKNSFQQVVMVPFPREGIYALGLISRESPPMCSRGVDKELISVLIPTTPNPTTGFLLMFSKKDLIYVDIRPEDAIKYIVSCGVIIPPDRSSTASP
ncbi:MAG: DUF502 domain-containing protein [Simkania sp.]|nr:DUF502 domain-containing protein [Simkania sp.]